MQNIERASLDRAPRRDQDNPEASLLYPLMLIAAIAAIVFSIVGIASLMGVLPRALSTEDGAADRGGAPARSEASRRTATADEPRSGVIKSIRAIQTRVPAPTLRATAGMTGTEAPGITPRPLSSSSAGKGDPTRAPVTYRVRVRMEDDGRLQTFYETTPPAYAVGQRVSVSGRTIVAAG
jgi:hypothetical protein